MEFMLFSMPLKIENKTPENLQMELINT